MIQLFDVPFLNPIYNFQFINNFDCFDNCMMIWLMFVNDYDGMMQLEEWWGILIVTLMRVESELSYSVSPVL